jgi:hypothetical protein
MIVPHIYEKSWEECPIEQFKVQEWEIDVLRDLTSDIFAHLNVWIL